MAELTQIISNAWHTAPGPDLLRLENEAIAALKDFWTRNPHGAMEYLEACALAFPYEIARQIVRDVTVFWKALPGYSWAAGGNADHCFLAAMLLTANYDLVEEDHFEACWNKLRHSERYSHREIADADSKLEALDQATFEFGRRRREESSDTSVPRGGRMSAPSSEGDRGSSRYVPSIYDTALRGQHSDDLVEKLSRHELVYSVAGLLLGLACVVGGIILFLAGVSGAMSWTARFLGATSEIWDAAPGAVLFIVGLFVVFVTRYKLKSQR